MDICRHMTEDIHIFSVYSKASPLLVFCYCEREGNFIFPVCVANNSRNMSSPPTSLFPFPGSFPLGFDKTSLRLWVTLSITSPRFLPHLAKELKSQICGFVLRKRTTGKTKLAQLSWAFGFGCICAAQCSAGQWCTACLQCPR